MIGIFLPSRKKPTKTGELYKSTYCSICIVLKEKYGFFFSLFICHEIVQMTISLLQYCDCLDVSECRCPLCYNRKKREIIRHNVFESAADCCLILVWLKIMDSIHDRERIMYRMLYYVFRNKIKLILQSSHCLEGAIERYLKIIDSNDMNTIMTETGAVACSIYSEMLSHTVAEEESIERLMPVADLYGKIIALADAVIDYEDDIKKHKQSPLNKENREKYTQQLFEEMNRGKSLIVELEREKMVSLYFQNIYVLSCYNLEKRVDGIKH